jgi:FkbM family methyltransferase
MIHQFPIRKYINILKTHDMPLWFLISRVLWRSRICLLFKIRRDGYVVRFRPTSLSAELWMRPDDRGDEEGLFARYLREGDCVVDVGANIGSVTLTAASRVGSHGSVYAFEPHPRIFGYLKENIEMNGFRNVHLFNLALGNVEGNVLFSNIRSDDQNAIIPDGQGIDVQVRPLDAIGIIEPCIHLLKIDTEGYEKFVLLGASELLKKTMTVYFESWEHAKYGYHPREVLQLLENAGFCVFKLHDGGLCPMPKQYDFSNGVENLIAVRALQDFLDRTES